VNVIVMEVSVIFWFVAISFTMFFVLARTADLAPQGSLSVALRVSAITAVGALGGAPEKPVLEKLKAGGEVTRVSVKRPERRMGWVE
jgi:hypothetical protein